MSQSDAEKERWRAAVAELAASGRPWLPLPYEAVIPPVPRSPDDMQADVLGAALQGSNANPPCFDVVLAEPDPRLAYYKRQELVGRAVYVGPLGGIVVVGDWDDRGITRHGYLVRASPYPSKHFLVDTKGSRVVFNTKNPDDILLTIAKSPWGYRWDPLLGSPELDGDWVIMPDKKHPTQPILRRITARGVRVDIVPCPSSALVYANGRFSRLPGNPFSNVNDARHNASLLR